MLLSIEFIYIVSVVLLILLVLAAVLSFFYRKKSILLETKLISVAKKSFEINSFVSFFSDKLSRYSVDSNIYALMAEKIAALADAENVCISLQENKHLTPVGYTDTFPLDTVKQEEIEFGENSTGNAGLSKDTVILDKSSPLLSQLIQFVSPATSLMAVPMLLNGQMIGVICAINSKISPQFTEAQISTFNAISKPVTVIHQIMRSFSMAAKQDRINQEIEFTKLLQTSLLPKKSPVWKPFVVHAFTRSAKEVNGDFYDFVEIDENKLLIVLGDASGKGIPACMMMAMVRSYIRANAEHFTSLSSLMTELNASLYRSSSEGRFATIACCLLDRKEESVEFARAGHTELMVFSTKQKVRKLRPYGAALGLLPNELTGNFDSISFTFKPYYTMLMFSDGIVESLNEKDEEFGIDNLQKVFYESCCNKNSPGECTDKILKILDEFSDIKELSDDQTLVVIGHEKSFV